MAEVDTTRTSDAFQTFLLDAPQHSQAWGQLIYHLSQASVLDTTPGASATDSTPLWRPLKSYV